MQQLLWRPVCVFLQVTTVLSSSPLSSPTQPTFHFLLFQFSRHQAFQFQLFKFSYQQDFHCSLLKFSFNQAFQFWFSEFSCPQLPVNVSLWAFQIQMTLATSSICSLFAFSIVVIWALKAYNKHQNQKSKPYPVAKVNWYCPSPMWQKDRRPKCS